jgi:hypothetical protein
MFQSTLREERQKGADSMTTATAAKPAKRPKTVRPASAKAARPKLRIRKELLPKTARYAEMNGLEYVCIPVKDFGDWYEDSIDIAVIEAIKDDDEPGTTFEEYLAEMERLDKARAKA